MIDILTTITTAAQTYTPPSGSIVLPSKTYFGQRGEYEPVPLVQYDDTLPIIAAALYLNGQPYTVPDGAAVNIRMAKGDGTYVYNPALGVSEDRQTVYIAVTYQMTVIAGSYCPILELVVSGDVAGTSELPLQIAENPVPEDAIASTDEYKTIQQLAAQVTGAAQVIIENQAAIQDISTNLTAIQNAPTAAANASASATLSESWAVGGTGARPGENTDNAQYYAQQAQQVAQGSLGWYATPQALQSAHPTGQNGQWAIIGSTDTIWTWDSDTNTWKNTSVKTDLSNYYTKSQTDSKYAPKNHASSAATYGLATGSVYGHVKLSDTAGSSGVSGGIAATPLGVKNAISAAAPDFTWHNLSITPQNCNLQYSYVRACYSSGARLMYMTFGILSATADRDVIVVRTPLPSGFSLAINDSELGALTKSGDNTVAENQMAGFLVRQNGNYLEIVEVSTNPSGWAKATIMLPLTQR